MYINAKSDCDVSGGNTMANIYILSEYIGLKLIIVYITIFIVYYNIISGYNIPSHNVNNCI